MIFDALAIGIFVAQILALLLGFALPLRRIYTTAIVHCVPEAAAQLVLDIASDICAIQHIFESHFGAFSYVKKAISVRFISNLIVLASLTCTRSHIVTAASLEQHCTCRLP
jgi:hypothetical protein